MTSRGVAPQRDSAPPDPRLPIIITFEGRAYGGFRGQSIAAILLTHGLREWRTTSVHQRPRGLFCGIGICFDCLVTVDGRRDVRACLCRPEGGERVTRQHDPLPHQNKDG